ncbi:MAG: histidine kinase [Oceanospirillaceae bacterium]|nr:histidine kinase [Oceanospirillaceae bacterium]|tara:strand:- start:319 stop:873 length:555 start_codon:yes stop_codon:yes gene_type:complete
MTHLTLHSVSAIDELAWPESPFQLTLESPATTFFTDFTVSEPLVIKSNIKAAAARKVMLKTHVRLKLVVNDKKQFVGIISSEDLSEQNLLRTAGAMNHDDLMVTDLMTRKQDLLALSLTEVDQSSIGDIVNFLKDNHRQHCLVIDGANHKIRGIFSASDISRKLKLPVNIQEQSSFYKVFAAVS